MATEITASAPVVVEGSGSITYDRWFLTQLVGRISPDKAPLVVHLQRAGTVDGKTVLMPTTDAKSDISFSLDVWKDMVETPEIGAAMEAVLTAVVAYATKKNLL